MTRQRTTHITTVSAACSVCVRVRAGEWLTDSIEATYTHIVYMLSRSNTGGPTERHLNLPHLVRCRNNSDDACYFACPPPLGVELSMSGGCRDSLSAGRASDERTTDIAKDIDIARIAPASQPATATTGNPSPSSHRALLTVKYNSSICIYFV